MARKLREGDAFAEQFRALIAEELIRDLIYVGLQNTIAIDPHVGVPLSATPPTAWYFFIPEAPGFGLSKMTVIYSFEEDGDDVQLDWVDFSDKG